MWKQLSAPHSDDEQSTFLNDLCYLLQKKSSPISVKAYEKLPHVGELSAKTVNLAPPFSSRGQLIRFLQKFEPTHIILDRCSDRFYDDVVNLMMVMTMKCILITSEVFEKKINDGIFL